MLPAGMNQANGSAAAAGKSKMQMQMLAMSDGNAMLNVNAMQRFADVNGCQQWPLLLQWLQGCQSRPLQGWRGGIKMLKDGKRSAASNVGQHAAAAAN